eukprot:scaffold15500_cov152-Skeletonema_dohrnii-CCMP3373.AAC.2
MAARGDSIIRRYNYTGGEVVPHDVTHVTTVIRRDAFYEHPNIEEVYLHAKIEKIGEGAFSGCPSLRRIIMPGAFNECEALMHVECAFNGCESLRDINLLTAKIVVSDTFYNCKALAEVKFGSKLESIEGIAFTCSDSLERITIPLKDGLINGDRAFVGCDNFKHVDLVQGPIHETIAALLLEEWRNDMNAEIDSINLILPNTCAGGWDNAANRWNEAEKAQAIRTWIRSVLRKIIHYKAEHQRLLDEEVATTLQLVLPQDIVVNNVIPFLELPSFTFEVMDHEEGEDEVEHLEELEGGADDRDDEEGW